MAKPTNDLGRDRVGTLLVRLALPAIAAQLINALYNICLLYTSDAADD